MQKAKAWSIRSAMSIINTVYSLVRPIVSVVIALHMVIYSEVFALVDGLTTKNSRTRRLLRGDNWFWKM